MSEQVIAQKEKSRITLGKAIQVRLVSDLERSQEYYRDCLGFSVDGWGHAERDEVCFILQQAVSLDDVRPNANSARRTNYPTEWEGPDRGWDTFLHIGWEEIDMIVDEIRARGAVIGPEDFEGSHGGWEFKNVHILDPDGYNIVLGAMRKVVNND